MYIYIQSSTLMEDFCDLLASISRNRYMFPPTWSLFCFFFFFFFLLIIGRRFVYSTKVDAT